MQDNSTCTIFDIKKYAIHDGPGIRTTVFFKGCPLSCLWCHNPEGLSLNPKVIYDNKRCVGCMACVELCPNKALSVTSDGIYAESTDSALCNQCSLLTCADVCPTKARELVGKTYSVKNILTIIEKDSPFYESSGGGVTFSGGEPLMQWKPLLELLKGCRELEIHTAVDTTGFASWSILETVAEFTDMFLFDLKIMDNQKHIFYTGVSNQLILENLERLAICKTTGTGMANRKKTKKGIVIRIPVIPGVNDDDLNIESTCQFIVGIGSVKEVNLLPYHNFQQSKYVKFGIDYKAQNISQPTDDQIKRVQTRLETFGLTVSVG